MAKQTIAGTLSIMLVTFIALVPAGTGGQCRFYTLLPTPTSNAKTSRNEDVIPRAGMMRSILHNFRTSRYVVPPSGGLSGYDPRLLMVGHFDKMVMHRGEAAMRGEFERLAPLMQRSGFIPSVDHQTPPGVSLEAYRSYLRLLEEYTT